MLAVAFEAEHLTAGAVNIDMRKGVTERQPKLREISRFLIVNG
ncbi:hypothetical protein [Brevundimonas sp.]|nr:hypothetical protein [Brevundimonas sp.]MDZ4361798.1 hypothetical protein [Brevundimonas sp.]